MPTEARPFTFNGTTYPAGDGCPYIRTHALLRQVRGAVRDLAVFCTYQWQMEPWRQCPREAVAWALIDDMGDDVEACYCARCGNGRRFSRNLAAYSPMCQPHNAGGWGSRYTR